MLLIQTLTSLFDNIFETDFNFTDIIDNCIGIIIDTDFNFTVHILIQTSTSLY